MVRYGTEDKWTEEKFVEEAIKCTAVDFGDDPAPGEEKVMLPRRRMAESLRMPCSV